MAASALKESTDSSTWRGEQSRGYLSRIELAEQADRLSLGGGTPDPKALCLIESLPRGQRLGGLYGSVHGDAHTGMSASAEINTVLAEYKALRDDIALHSHRIDRTIGIYLTALFAVLGYLVRPETVVDVPIYLARLSKSPGLTTLVLLVPVLNSLLLIRLMTFFLAMLAMAEYSTYTLGKRLNALIGQPGFGWDASPSVGTKGTWLAFRVVSQGMFFLIAQGISGFVLWYFSSAFNAGWGLRVLYAASVAAVSTSVVAGGIVVRCGSRFGRGLGQSDLGRLAVAIESGVRTIAADLWAGRVKDVVPVRDVRRSMGPFFCGLGLGSLAMGIVYITVFAPLAWKAALQVGLDPVDVLLLQRGTGELDAAFFSNYFPRFSLPEARPTVYALGALYGALGVVLAVTVLAGNYVRIAVTSNGISWGFVLTSYLAVRLGLLEVDAFSQRLFQVKLAYVLLAYYLAEGLIVLLGGRGIKREKYEFLFEGAYGLVAGWILARGFGVGAVVFSGVLFLSTTFVMMALAERLIGTMIGVMLGTIGRSGQVALAREGRGLATVVEGIRLAPREAAIAAVLVFVVFGLWPALVSVAYKALLEGKL